MSMELHIAILGGNDASTSSLHRQYRQVLASRMREERGIDVKFIVDRQDQGGESASRLRRCMKEFPVDAVILHVNPLPYLRRCKPLITMKSADCFGENDTHLHPRLIPIFHGDWSPEWDETAAEAAEAGPASSGLDNVQAFIGMALGLGAWARRMESGKLWEIRGLCIDAKKPLFVLGPAPLRLGGMEKALCFQLSRHLRRDLEGSEAAYIDSHTLSGEAERQARIAESLFYGLASVDGTPAPYVNSLNTLTCIAEIP